MPSNAMDTMKAYGNSMAQGCVLGTGTALLYAGAKAALAGPEGVGAVAVAGCLAGAAGSAVGLHQSRQAAQSAPVPVAPSGPKL